MMIDLFFFILSGIKCKQYSSNISIFLMMLSSLFFLLSHRYSTSLSYLNLLTMRFNKKIPELRKLKPAYINSPKTEVLRFNLRVYLISNFASNPLTHSVLHSRRSIPPYKFYPAQLHQQNFSTKIL
jgi:hypothetical protein